VPLRQRSESEELLLASAAVAKHSFNRQAGEGKFVDGGAVLSYKREE
jgi:hypothetical protein